MLALWRSQKQQVHILHDEALWNMDMPRKSLLVCPLLSECHCQWRLFLIETQGQGSGRQHLGWVLVFCTSPAESCNAWPVLPDYLCPLKGNTNQQQVLDMSSEWYDRFKPANITFWLLYFNFYTMESNKWKLLSHHNTSKPNHNFNVKFKYL